MARKVKLLEKLLCKPKDFTYSEAKRLLGSFGYFEYNKGKTSGSRVRFLRESDKRFILLHKPHPGDIMPFYTVEDIIEFLKEGGDIDE